MKEPEEYKIEREFIKSIGGRRQLDSFTTVDLLSKFKTYLIEQGKHTPTERFNRMGNVARSRQERIKELEKEVQQYRDTTVSISNNEYIRQSAYDNGALFGVEFDYFYKGAKWMLEKLTGKA